MTTYKIKLTPKAKFFIEERMKDIELYGKRGGVKEEDLLVGVYAELAVYKHLKSLGFIINKPDFEIHKKKSFGADFISDVGIKYHVKGQSLSSRNKYGDSWLLQRSDRIVKNQSTIKDEYILGCTVNVDNGEVKIILNKPVSECKYGECKLVWFQKTKVAIYLEANI